MKKIVGVRFKKPGKIYFFDPQDMVIEKNDDVIVETSMGDEIGKVVVVNREIDESKMATPLKKVLRKATAEDLESQKNIKKKSQKR